MPELTEILQEKVEDPTTTPRIEDDEDNDSEDTLPELEDAGKYIRFV